MRTLNLPDNLIKQLIALPETGMGYHIVKVILKSGEILRQHKVLNSSILVLEEKDHFNEREIQQIEPEPRS